MKSSIRIEFEDELVEEEDIYNRVRSSLEDLGNHVKIIRGGH